MHQLRRQAHGQVARQGKARQVEDRRLPIGRRPPEQHGKRMARHAPLLAQRRHQRLVDGELGLGAEHVGIGHHAGAALLVHQIEVLPVDRDDVVDRLQLRLDGGDLNGLGHRVAGQAEIGRVELIDLHVGQGLVLLDLSVPAAEQVGVEADGGPDGEEVEIRRQRKGARALAERSGTHLLARRGAGDAELRIERAGGGANLLACLGQRRDRGRERRAAGNSFAHHLIDLGRLKELPPVAGDSAAECNILPRRAATRIGVAAEFVRRIVTRRLRRLRRFEVRPDLAAGEGREHSAGTRQAEQMSRQSTLSAECRFRHRDDPSH